MATAQSCANLFENLGVASGPGAPNVSSGSGTHTRLFFLGGGGEGGEGEGAQMKPK